MERAAALQRGACGSDSRSPGNGPAPPGDRDHSPPPGNLPPALGSPAGHLRISARSGSDRYSRSWRGRRAPGRAHGRARARAQHAVPDRWSILSDPVLRPGGARGVPAWGGVFPPDRRRGVDDSAAAGRGVNLSGRSRNVSVRSLCLSSTSARPVVAALTRTDPPQAARGPVRNPDASTVHPTAGARGG